jgi:diguanylate cyclase (GGDEF)-like protein
MTKYNTGDLLTEFEIVRSLLAHKEWRQEDVYAGLTGTSVFGTATHIDLVNWGVVSEIPEKMIAIPIVETLLSMAAIVFGVITLFGMIGFWIVSRATKPIAELTDVFDHVAKGDYSRSLHPSPIKEINAIVEQCNGMVAEIKDKECQRENLISVLEESNAKLERSEDKLRETLKRMDMAYEQSMIYAKELVGEVSERKKSEDIARHMAYHDHLTGLPNRLLLIDRFNYILAEAKRYHRLGAVIFLDLDNFKVINDTLGHAEGDELLKAVAKRLNTFLRASDTLARHGGDEFTIIIQDLKKVNNITKVVDDIFSKFEEPFFLERQEFFITTSMGISIYPNDGMDADTLLKNADIAMYKAKEDGKNTYQLFDSVMNEKALERVVLESKLRKAIESKDFILHYQPQIEINSGETVGLEALLRWEEKEIGLIPPGQFIPLAEDTGLIVPIGEWVLHAACLQNRLWQDKGLNPVNIAVNVSLRQFKQNDFVDNVKRIVADTHLNPKYLELEITESSIMEDVRSNIELLHELKSLGLKLSIDDFGTGYSSFEYLKQLPIDILKIDLSFIRDITENTDDTAIVEAIIKVAHTLKLDVIAEGVETIDQFRLLDQLQCDKIQGYLVAKPLSPSKEFERFLAKNWRFIVDESYNKGHDQPTIVL